MAKLKQVIELLTALIDGKFYGEFTIKFRAGEIAGVIKTETMNFNS